jgi:hypothetical protein
VSACPDWNALAAHRFAREAEEPAGWHAALEHFDTCALCRPAALAADPTLVFRRLPEVEMTPAREAAEVEAVRRAVTAMRTASRAEAAEARQPAAFAGWRRWSAAAGLALLALSLGGEQAWRLRPVALDAAHGADTVKAVPALAATVAPAMPAAQPPMIEDLNRPDARVYQVDGEGLDLVMIYSESLDV